MAVLPAPEPYADHNRPSQQTECQHKDARNISAVRATDTKDKVGVHLGLECQPARIATEHDSGIWRKAIRS